MIRAMELGIISTIPMGQMTPQPSMKIAVFGAVTTTTMPIVYSTQPIRNVFFLPSLSPSRPAVTISEPAISEAATITVCNVATVVPRSTTMELMSTLMPKLVMYIIIIELAIAISGSQLAFPFSFMVSRFSLSKLTRVAVGIR